MSTKKKVIKINELLQLINKSQEALQITYMYEIRIKDPTLVATRVPMMLLITSQETEMLLEASQILAL